MPPTSSKLDVAKAFADESIQTELTVKTKETPEDRAVRILKERWNFFVKEIGPYILAAVSVLAIGVYCLAVLSQSASSMDDKQWARSTLSVIVAGVVGVIFGKATK